MLKVLLTGKKIGGGTFGKCYLVKENKTKFELILALKVNKIPIY
jgi:hypothetical protein